MKKEKPVENIQGIKTTEQTTLKMYNQRPADKTVIKGIQPAVGESMITKMQRILTSGEPISDTAQKIYQDRSDGINPLANIKTDRFELATEAKGKDANDMLTKRADILKAKTDTENPPPAPGIDQPVP
nr:MAG: hypothetical protein [Microviridae sp.]